MSISLALEKVIFTEKYWKRPKQSQKGDDSQQPIYEAVGQALSNWEEADQELSELFLIFTCDAGEQVDVRVRNAVRRAYGSIISNSGRRLAVEAAAEVYFSPWRDDFKKPIRKSLTDILNVVQWASKLRDDIAHGIVWPYMTIQFGVSEGVTKTEKIGCFLLPPEYKTDRTYAFPQSGGHPTEMLKAEYCFTSKDIKDIVFNFIAVRALIQRYKKLVTKNSSGEMPLIEQIKRDATAKAEKKK
jgi:hypothetical protein